MCWFRSTASSCRRCFTVLMNWHQTAKPQIISNYPRKSYLLNQRNVDSEANISMPQTIDFTFHVLTGRTSAGTMDAESSLDGSALVQMELPSWCSGVHMQKSKETCGSALNGNASSN